MPPPPARGGLSRCAMIDTCEIAVNSFSLLQDSYNGELSLYQQYWAHLPVISIDPGRGERATVGQYSESGLNHLLSIDR